MPDSVEAQLRGDTDVRAALSEFRDLLPKRLIPSAMRQAAAMLQKFVALVAPKFTGRLARLISVRTRRTRDEIRARVVVKTSGKRGDPENAFYWRFLEEGFHTKKGDFRRFPFIAGVFESKNEEAAQQVLDVVDKAIARAERRAKRAGVI